MSIAASSIARTSFFPGSTSIAFSPWIVTVGIGSDLPNCWMAGVSRPKVAGCPPGRVGFQGTERRPRARTTRRRMAMGSRGAFQGTRRDRRGQATHAPTSATRRRRPVEPSTVGEAGQLARIPGVSWPLSGRRAGPSPACHPGGARYSRLARSLALDSTPELTEMREPGGEAPGERSSDLGAGGAGFRWRWTIRDRWSATPRIPRSGRLRSGRLDVRPAGDCGLYAGLPPSIDPGALAAGSTGRARPGRAPRRPAGRSRSTRRDASGNPRSSTEHERHLDRLAVDLGLDLAPQSLRIGAGLRGE